MRGRGTLFRLVLYPGDDGMKENLHELLKNWGLEGRTIQEAKDTGAAIATGVWHLGPDYSLKTGGNFEGLRHHIHISRVLADQGITASCPLPTLDGEDFLTCGDHYFVITERVTDNFLSTKQTPQGKEPFYLERYAREVRSFDAALHGGNRDFAEVMAWADKESARTAKAFGMPWNGIPRDCAERFSALSTEPSEFFVCATKVEASPSAVADALDALSRPRGLMAMLAVFVAWTAGQTSLSALIRGNLSLAAALSHGLCARADA